jgi:hypothetical protein
MAALEAGSKHVLMAMSPMTSWLILMILGGAVAVGVVLANTLLGNRHTHGVTKGMLVIGAVFLGLVALWVMNRAQVTRTAEILPPTAEQQATAEYYFQLAERMQQGQGLAPTMAQEYREKANEALQPRTVYRSSTSHDYSYGFGFVSPVLLLPFLVILFLLFKHCGPGVGLAALAVPVVFLLFGYASLNQQRSYQTSYGPHGQYTHSMPVIDSGSGQSEMVEAAAISVEDSIPTGEIAVQAAGDPDAAQAEAEASGTAQTVDSDEPASEGTSEGISLDDPIAGPPPASAEAKPDWVQEPPKSVENVYRQVVESSWYPDAQTCQQQIRGPVDQAISAYLYELRPDVIGQSVSVPPLEQLGITPRYIRENLIADEYYETRYVEHLAKDMVNLHALVEFDRTDTDFVVAKWRDHLRQKSVVRVAMALAGVLASLAGVLGLIKLDTFTKGYYTKRLFIGVPAAIIGTGVLLAFLK